MTTIAVIGAGLAGLTFAAGLHSRARVVVFEKSRGLSGRMATRRADPYAFDHGAQYFRARTRDFRSFLHDYAERGIVHPWHARYVELDRNREISSELWSDTNPCYVAAPAMNSLAKALAAEIDIRLQTRVAGMRTVAGKWQLRDEDGGELGNFDWVIAAIPAPQAVDLMPATFEHGTALRGVRLSACFTLMLGFEQPLDFGWDAARIHDADVSWIAVNSSKPGRNPDHFSVVAQSSNDWADAHIEDDPKAVTRHLSEEIRAITGEDPAAATHRALHRWRYANLGSEQSDASLVDERNRLAACGDWCGGGRVEAAFLAARRICARVESIL
ncbi:MAG: FAD-dependent oxidoreductase [Gammaproteobacteria bacterium]|nr:FAD-dependent oxidoreductase [Gammaproteobacteria bacterium]